MNPLHQRQCLHHAAREAVARCPDCGHCYCRECIAEHEDRVLCATCLRKLARAAEKPRRPAGAWLARGTLFGAGLTLGWMAYYLLGRLLLSVPASVHDGTLWHSRS